jgi:hypothetical protein
LKRWTIRGKWVALVCFISLVCPVGMASADQPDNPAEPIDWDVLPNGLIGVQYDRAGDGVPDHVDLHQITWSGWTDQPLREIEAQARLDRQWVFIVEYDGDRYVYLASEDALFVADDPQQDSRWTALPGPCHMCTR